MVMELVLFSKLHNRRRGKGKAHSSTAAAGGVGGAAAGEPGGAELAVFALSSSLILAFLASLLLSKNQRN